MASSTLMIVSLPEPLGECGWYARLPHIECHITEPETKDAFYSEEFVTVSV